MCESIGIHRKFSLKTNKVKYVWARKEFACLVSSFRGVTHIVQMFSHWSSIYTPSPVHGKHCYPFISWKLPKLMWLCHSLLTYSILIFLINKNNNGIHSTFTNERKLKNVRSSKETCIRISCALSRPGCYGNFGHSDFHTFLNLEWIPLLRDRYHFYNTPGQT